MSADNPVNLFLIFPVKDERSESFRQLIVANAIASRQEDGCHSFDVFLPEGEANPFYLFEQWDNQAALDNHGRQPHLEAVRQQLPDSLAGTPTKHRLTQLFTNISRRRTTADPSPNRNVIVVLQVEPERRTALMDAFQQALPPCCAADGNLTFEIYQDEIDPNIVVLLERWTDAEAHQRHLDADYLKTLHEVMFACLSRPLLDGRYLLTDIVPG